MTEDQTKEYLKLISRQVNVVIIQIVLMVFIIVLLVESLWHIAEKIF